MVTVAVGHARVVAMVTHSNGVDQQRTVANGNLATTYYYYYYCYYTTTILDICLSSQYFRNYSTVKPNL